MHRSADHRRTAFARYRHGQWALWLAALLLAFQLIASTQHKHDLSVQDGDCASCFVVGHLPSGLPSVDLLPVATTAATLAYRIAAPSNYRFIAATSFLIPHGQAPPLSFH